MRKASDLYHNAPLSATLFLQYKSRRAGIKPIVKADDFEPPACAEIQAPADICHETTDSVQTVHEKSNGSRKRGPESLENRRHLCRMAEWMRQSVNSTITSDESCRFENVGGGGGGLNKHWRWYHQKRTSDFLRELQLSPMLPFEFVEENCRDMLRELLKNLQSLVHQKDPRGSCLTHHATIVGRLEILKLLVYC
ncbi:hypothetical protein FGIG_04725 [Fasciola gigantica]|uniref:Uncharacterized protein n=1 Tax=Fasciola gigantica TaxID=46835 RepID=A0A504Z515_FASGI|nr:hypothetical protein FGIG_04725 [Fasciola gigantica]